MSIFNLVLTYTVNGQGMGVVTDPDLPGVWFRPEGDMIRGYNGKPIMHLDGGAYADTPGWPVDIDLVEMLLEDHPKAEQIDAATARAYMAAIRAAKEAN